MKNWKSVRVLILGAARQGLALARFLSKKGAIIVLNDQRPLDSLAEIRREMEALGIRCAFGGHRLELLEGVDIVCLSGGIPLTLPIVVEASRLGIPLTNDSQIFMESVAAPVIGITGSAGKTTTTSLVGRMAHFAIAEPNRVWVGGNIGMPLIEQVDEIQPDDLVVLELSSFQLEQLTLSPQVSAILNITPNHLDRHGSMQAYTAAKTRILDFQKKEDIAILNRDDAGSWGTKSRVRGRLLTFGMEQPVAGVDGTFMESGSLWLTRQERLELMMPGSLIQLRGQHNLMNVLAASAIAAAAGLSVDAMRAGVDGFTGVVHRLEWVREYHGAQWYNDSIATAPERTMAALQSFEEPLVLLLGGRDKDLPWDDLAHAIHQRVDHVIVFGEASEKILKALGPQSLGRRPYSLDRFTHMKDALLKAVEVAEPGDVVLLSPGGTSFDEFKDFEERGEFFRKWLNQLQ